MYQEYSVVLLFTINSHVTLQYMFLSLHVVLFSLVIICVFYLELEL